MLLIHRIILLKFIKIPIIINENIIEPIITPNI